MSVADVRAADVRAVLNSQGWKVVAELAQGIVDDAKQATIDCDDEAAVIRLQRKAQAAREFWIELVKRAEAVTRVETQEFQGVCY